jgi:ABC-2 type transport system ATP-binding protein
MTSHDTDLVSCQGLSKTYGDTMALDGLDLQLKHGGSVALLGPNGAGKTTAISIFMGILSPTSGDVKVLGYSPMTERHRFAGRINFSSAYVQLPSNLKVIENMRIFARLYGVKDRENKIAALLQKFNLTDYRDRLTGALSSGERTRLNLCKAFLNDPELLLLDEPTASLDPEMADTVRMILREERARRGLGMVYTSHNMNEVEALCDDVVFLEHGKVIARGAPAEIRAQHGGATLDEIFIKLVRK